MTHTLIAQALNFRSEANTQKLPTSDVGIGPLLTNILIAIMALAILTVFVLIITAAMEWINSGGDKGKLDSARNKITNSIIGLIVLASVLAIISLVQSILKVEVFSFK